MAGVLCSVCPALSAGAIGVLFCPASSAGVIGVLFCVLPGVVCGSDRSAVLSGAVRYSAGLVVWCRPSVPASRLSLAASRRPFRFGQGGGDGLHENLGGVLVILRVGKILHGLLLADLGRQIVERRLHQGIHGGNSLVQIYQTDGIDIVGVHHNLHIHRLAAQNH